MNYETLTECTKCGSDACYVQEVSAEIKIEMCFGCGFMTNTLLRRETQFFIEQMEVLPEINKALMVEEEDTGKIWMPSFIHVEDKGMVFANGTSIDNWKWGAVKSVKTTKEEKLKMKGEKYKADYSTLKEFTEREFIDALGYIGILQGDLV